VIVSQLILKYQRKEKDQKEQERIGKIEKEERRDEGQRGILQGQRGMSEGWKRGMNEGRM
jgi:hypothetical protein